VKKIEKIFEKSLDKGEESWYSNLAVGDGPGENGEKWLRRKKDKKPS
jgi:hypothetical protein